jgi:hypothetical protein
MNDNDDDGLFFRGLVIALPISFALWVLIVLVVRWLLA